MKEGEPKDRKLRDYRCGEISLCRGEPAGRERETAWEGTKNAVERRMDEIQIVFVGQQMLLNWC